ISALGSGRKAVTVRATARTGITRDATARVEMPDFLANGAAPDIGFHYHCDDITLTAAGRIALSGWAVCEAPAEAILVLLDGEEVGHAELGLERPEVGNLFPALPHARRPGL